jgi:hypothetical protein
MSFPHSKNMVPMVTILLLFIKGRKVFFVEIFFSYFRKSYVRLEHQYFFLHQYINIVLVLVPMTQWFVKRILKFWFLTGGRETMVSKYILWENHHGHYFPVKLTKHGTSNCIFYTRNKTVILYDLSAQ